MSSLLNTGIFILVLSLSRHDFLMLSFGRRFVCRYCRSPLRHCRYRRYCRRRRHYCSTFLSLAVVSLSFIFSGAFACPFSDSAMICRRKSGRQDNNDIMSTCYSSSLLSCSQCVSNKNNSSFSLRLRRSAIASLGGCCCRFPLPIMMPLPARGLLLGLSTAATSCKFYIVLSN